jgi:polyisoprenoid-binding protein YceI
MKKIGILVMAVAFVTMSFVMPTAPVEEIFTVDASSSSLTWKGYKPTGSHNGTIMLQSGNITMNGDKITAGSFVADMSTIKDADESARLEGHLKSADFFEIEVYKTAQFEITKTTIKEGKTQITGNLTIKDITKKITFEATTVIEENTLTLTSEMLKINRAEFNIKYKSKSFFNDLKEKFIEDEFELQVTIVAKK